MTVLDDAIARLTALPAAALAEVKQRVDAATAGRRFIPSPGPQTDAWRSRADVLLYGGAAGGGKRLDDDTPIPVPLSTDPSGWLRHGDLRPGDEVFSPRGCAVRVLAVDNATDEADAYAVAFSTGEVIVADGDHLWHTWTERERARKLRASDEWRAKRRASRPSRAVAVSQKPWASASISVINRQRVYAIEAPEGGVRTTRQILATLVTDRGGPNHSIDATKPIDGQDVDLPIAPYLLGLWLGDGHTNNAGIGMLQDDWKEVGLHCEGQFGSSVECRPPRARPFETRRYKGMQAALRASGLLGCKHIPPVYMRASKTQRLALFQGLMDTDGTCGVNGQMELGFSDARLAGDALELAASLGIKASMQVKKTYRKDHFRFKFVAPERCFRLTRKAERQDASVCPEVTRRRYIVDVRPVPPRPMRCIRVDHQDGLYLVGRSFIATHNSAILCGLALEEHQRSLLMRRSYAALEGGGTLVETLLGMYGSRAGFNGSKPMVLRTADGRVITFGAAFNIGDEDTFQGRPRDFLGIDEAAQFAEIQVRTLMGWVRSEVEGQRKRTLLASNPPMDSTGEWLIGMFRPWLDLTHPNPAKPGELRWFVTDPDGKDMEVDGPGLHSFSGVEKPVEAQSRTFIPARLSDNPFLVNTGYDATLDAMPEPMRSAMRDGNFMLSRQDRPFQMIPTAWIWAAQERWTDDPPEHSPMCALAVDVAQGGADRTVLQARYDHWFARPDAHPGASTPTGNEAAGLVIATRRNGAKVVVDMGGGYGGAVAMRLRDNGIEVVPYKGADEAKGRTKDGAYGFTNKRSMAYWRLREALDPAQDDGSLIALPPDPELVSDLTAVDFEITQRGIKATPKDKVIEMLGRSPDKGDAAVMAWSAGGHHVTHGETWRQYARQASPKGGPNVVMSRMAARRRR